jgi:hypothetical protein
MGAAITRFERRLSNGFRIDPDDVRRAVTPRTRLIVVTTPHNPSGVAIDRATLSALANLAASAGAHLLVDEVYLDAASLVAGVPETSASAARLDGPIVVTSSLTKSYGLAASGPAGRSPSRTSPCVSAARATSSTTPGPDQPTGWRRWRGPARRLAARARALLGENVALARDVFAGLTCWSWPSRRRALSCFRACGTMTAPSRSCSPCSNGTASRWRPGASSKRPGTSASAWRATPPPWRRDWRSSPHSGSAVPFDLAALTNLIVAALGGLAVGIEREWSGKATGPRARFAGIRTFTLLGIVAGLSGWLWTVGLTGPALVFLAGLGALVVIAYQAASRRDVDGTTEVSAFVVLAAGVLAGAGYDRVASAIIAVTVLLLVEKKQLHRLVRRLGVVEMRAGVRFAVMAAVILPLLPGRPVRALRRHPAAATVGTGAVLLRPQLRRLPCAARGRVWPGLCPHRPHGRGGVVNVR